MASKLVKGNLKMKRAGDAQEATGGIVTDAAKDAASRLLTASFGDCFFGFFFYL